MSRRLIGILTDPSGTPLAGWTLILDARRNSAPTVPLGSRESVVLDVSGSYDLLVSDGLYQALITAPGDTVQRRLGLFLVAPGTDIDVLTLIGLYTPAGSPGIDGSAAVSAHVALSDPHTQYATDADLTAHVAAADPHPTYQKEAEKGAASGYASLDAGGTVPDAQIPAAIARDSEVTAAVASLVPNTRTVNGHPLSADVTVSASDVGLGSADNTSDLAKPVSTAQQTALNLKQDTSGKDASGGYAGLTLLKLNLRNAANTITSFFTTAATAARTWTLPDKDGTIAMLSDTGYLGEFTFADLPAAASNARKLATLTDSVFASGGILVQSDGTRWRPVGDQVLASGPASSITIQDTTETAMLVVGPFPGGMVKTGDRLSMHILGQMRGVGTGQRSTFMRVGANGSISDDGAFRVLGVASITTATTGGDFSAMPILFVTNDTSGTHEINNRFSAFNETGLYSPTAASAMIRPTIDFSAPWYVTLSGQSAAETAVNITSSSWSGGVATHISTAHTLNTGDKTTIAGVSLAGYNAEFSPVTRIDANTFSVPLAADPGGAGTGGTTRRVSNVILQRYRLMWSS